MSKFGRKQARETRQALMIAVLAAGFGMSAWSCKKKPTSDPQAAKTPEQKKIAEEVAAYDETRKAINELNRSPSSKSAEKLSLMWDRIVSTKQDDDKIVHAAAGVSPIVFGNGSVERFWRIFTGWATQDGGSEVRPNERVPDILKKYIRLTHRYSVFSKLKYVPTAKAKQLGYTGQFAEGNSNVLGRFSSAVPPSVPDRFTPAFSSKFFLDGKNESQVLITQHDVGGQSFNKDRIYNNYWEKALSNRLSFENNVRSGVGAFSRFFYTAEYFSKEVFNLPYVFDPRELQADHLAQYTPDGKAVSNPKGPRFVWTVAGTPGVKSFFQQFDKPGADYRNMFLALNKPTDMVPGSGRDEGGIVIMRLFGSDKWTNNPEADADLLGEFVTTSKFVASDASDQRLFFRHSISFFHYVGVDAPENSRFQVRADKGRDLNAEVATGAYTKDYPYALWSTAEARDKLFASDCVLGVKGDEVRPVKIPLFDPEGLNGTYVVKAIVTRKDAQGKLCAPTVLEGLAKRAKEKAPEKSESAVPGKALDENDTTLDKDDKKGLDKGLRDLFDYTNDAGSSWQSNTL